MAIGSHRPDPFHFRSLVLENVRAFGPLQTLNLVDQRGRAAKWVLILGENGVGKTTIMQSLARMRPIPSLSGDQGDANVSRSPSSELPSVQAKKIQTNSGEDAGSPRWTQAELSQHENYEIHRFLRSSSEQIVATISAELEGPKGALINVGVSCEGDQKELRKVSFSHFEYELSAEGPLVIGYGASRHVGHANAASIEVRDLTDPLFSESFDLFDAEEILARLHYASLAGKGTRDGAKLDALKAAIADLIPDLDASDIDVRGPQVPGRAASNTGVHVKTLSGVMPLSELSHGAQTVFAWTVDLAWRMFNAYPTSVRPLYGSGIVLVDEIDLHLHPRWQRSLRRHLARHFPNIQFIATTHSPVTAQETLASGGKVAVVLWEGDHAVILNDPLPSNEWRIDQVLASDLFGFETARGPEAEAKLGERRSLLRKQRLTKKEKERLEALDGFAAALPTARTPAEQEFEDLLAKVAKLEGVSRTTK